jgi:hydroxypyruvate isomerase
MLGFSANLSTLFTEFDFLDRFKAAKACGFNAVEIQFPYAYPVDAIANALQENDLQLTLFNVAADDLLEGGEGLAAAPKKCDQFREAVAEAVAYAKQLEPLAINILPGRMLVVGREQEYLATFIDNLRYALDAFSSLGIKTVFEAINTQDMPGYLIHSGQQMLKIIEQVDHPGLFMQYDIYHMLMMNENPLDFIDRYADKIGHIQFADIPGRGQPGTGKVDFNRLFQTISKSSYSGWVGAEYKPLGETAKSLAWYDLEKQLLS